MTQNRGGVDEFLKEFVKPSLGITLHGAKYRATVKGFDNYRAIIEVKHKQHHLIAVVKIK